MFKKKETPARKLPLARDIKKALDERKAVEQVAPAAPSPREYTIKKYSPMGRSVVRKDYPDLAAAVEALDEIKRAHIINGDTFETDGKDLDGNVVSITLEVLVKKEPTAVSYRIL